MGKCLCILFILTLALLQPGQHTPMVLAAPSHSRLCFAETGHCIHGRMREFWEQYGGLPIFGFPITPAQTEMIEGQSRQVQWFERVRMDLHPENLLPMMCNSGAWGLIMLPAQMHPGVKHRRIPAATSMKQASMCVSPS